MPLVPIIGVIIIPKMPSESARQGLFISLSVIGALILLFGMIDFFTFIYRERKTSAGIIISIVSYGILCMPWILFYVFFSLHNTIVNHEKKAPYDLGRLSTLRKNLRYVRTACLVASIIDLLLVIVIFYNEVKSLVNKAKSFYLGLVSIFSVVHRRATLKVGRSDSVGRA